MKAERERMSQNGIVGVSEKQGGSSKRGPNNGGLHCRSGGLLNNDLSFSSLLIELRRIEERIVGRQVAGPSIVLH
jgi:hypothetical protein